MINERLQGDEDEFRAPYRTLDFYMTEASRYPLLSREEERDVARLVRDGKNSVAEEKLATSNLKLVVKIALEYHHAHLEILDLVQEGNVGLLHAVKKYDPEKGAKFSVYAAFWIRACILKHIIDSWSLVKVGTTRSDRKLFYRMNRERGKAAMDASPTLLARNLGVKEREVVEMQQRLACQDLSLDAPLHDESHETLKDTIRGHENIEDIVSDNEEYRIVSKMITDFRGTLNEREAVVLDRRIIAEDPASLRDLGDALRISHERVRQIERGVANKLNKRVDELRTAVGQ